MILHPTAGTIKEGYFTLTEARERRKTRILEDAG
jgi:hypothetical protein